MIIFDEWQYAQELENKDFKGYISWKDLFILAKYHRFLGQSTSKIREKLESFCLDHLPEYNPFFYEEKIRSAIERSKKHDLKIPQEVVITKAEIERIRSFGNYRLEKILFVLLVVSKNNYSSSHTGIYYMNQNFSAIVSLAKVYMSRVEREKIEHEFFIKNLVSSPDPHRNIDKYDKESFIILYVDNKSEEYLRITDFSRIVSFYRPLCEKCGKEMEVRKRRKICDKCYLEYRLGVKRMSEKRRRKRGQIITKDLVKDIRNAR